jgi:pimeloyl-ACP methyl ester carboxylesterase
MTRTPPLPSLALTLVACAGCEPSRAAPVTPITRAAGPQVAPPIALPAELSAQGPGPGYHHLAVPGFSEAIVYVPRSEGPHTVVVAAHGNYDRPEWQCAAWHRLTAERALILCPRGVARDDSPSADDVRFTYNSQRAFEREVEASLAALRATFGARVSDRPIVYVAFSLGSIFGVGYLRDTRERVAAAVLIEGGHTLWSGDAVHAFAQKGARALVFGCGQAWCARDARSVEGRFRGAHIETAVGYAPGSGHSYAGRVAEAIRPDFERLIAPALDPTEPSIP